MKFIVTKRKGEVQQEVIDYAEKKLLKLEKFFSKDATANLTFNEVRELKVVEVTVACSGIYYRAEQEDKDEFAVIDKIIDILERQIRKHKTKLEKKIRIDAFEDYKSAMEEEITYDVVRTKKFDMTPYTVDDAILQMEMLGHKFFFFVNADNNNTHAVLYTRAHGGYGIIQG